jgi:hypothetical protein
MQSICAILSYVAILVLQRFPHYLINDAIFDKKVSNIKLCFDCLHNLCLKYFSFWENFSEILSKMYIGLHIKYPLFLADINDTWTFRQILQKFLNIIFYENTPSGSGAVPYGQKGEPTDIKKLIVAFRKFAIAPKSQSLITAYRNKGCSYMHAEHIRVLCVQNVEFFMLSPMVQKINVEL